MMALLSTVLRRAVPAAAAVVAVLTACGATSTPSSTAPATPNGQSVIHIDAFEFGYTPSLVRIPAGRPVTFEVQNTGQVFHTLVTAADGYRQGSAKDLQVSGEDYQGSDYRGATSGVAGSIALGVDAGRTATVTFTAMTPGSYTLICDVAGHAAAGQVMTVQVGG